MYPGSLDTDQIPQNETSNQGLQCLTLIQQNSDTSAVVKWTFYKTFFMLNSAEHEIFSANKYENANNSWHFHIY